MLKIGDFSSISQVTIKALRHYDRLGLLPPARVDRFTGHRFYTLDQVPRLNRILALKDLGLSLDEIKRILDEDVSAVELRGMLRLKQAQLASEISSAQDRLQRVQARIEQLEERNTMSDYDVVVKAVPAQRVLSIRETLATSGAIAPLFVEIEAALKAQQIKPTGAWMMLYHHQGFRDTDLDLEIAVPVAESVVQAVALDDQRQLQLCQTTAYQRVASVIEDGHQADWSGSTSALGQFMEINGESLVGPMREVYLTAPDDEAGWLVELQMPLQAASLEEA